MTTIYLVRHGEYENPDYLFPGRSRVGFPLSERGRAQVQTLAGYFSGKPIAALYSSSIVRCRQTAEILSKKLHLPIRFDDRLLEVKTLAEGVSMRQFDETNGALSYTPAYQAKGAESMQALSDRMVSFVEEKRTEHEGKHVLVVTHGDPLRFCVMKYLGLPITFAASRTVAIPLASGYRVDIDAQGNADVNPIVLD